MFLISLLRRAEPTRAYKYEKPNSLFLDLSFSSLNQAHFSASNLHPCSPPSIILPYLIYMKNLPIFHT